MGDKENFGLEANLSLTINGEEYAAGLHYIDSEGTDVAVEESGASLERMIDKMAVKFLNEYIKQVNEKKEAQKKAEMKALPVEDLLAKIDELSKQNALLEEKLNKTNTQKVAKDKLRTSYWWIQYKGVA